MRKSTDTTVAEVGKAAFQFPRHRHPREDPREDVGVGVDVGVVECGLKTTGRPDTS